MADTSLDFISSLNVDVVDISPALHQHVGHGEHQTAQPVVLVHFPNNRVDQEVTENTFSGVCSLATDCTDCSGAVLGSDN